MYRIINGRLCDINDKPVPLEVGKKEQIDFLRRYEAMKIEGVVPIVSSRIQYHTQAKLKCHCGGYVVREVESDYEGDIDSLDSKHASCGGCYTKYRFTLNEDDLLVARIV